MAEPLSIPPEGSDSNTARVAERLADLGVATFGDAWETARQQAIDWFPSPSVAILPSFAEVATEQPTNFSAQLELPFGVENQSESAEEQAHAAFRDWFITHSQGVISPEQIDGLLTDTTKGSGLRLAKAAGEVIGSNALSKHSNGSPGIRAFNRRRYY